MIHDAHGGDPCLPPRAGAGARAQFLRYTQDFGSRLPLTFGSLTAARHLNYNSLPMANPAQPNIKILKTSDYRETYANSVQVRMNVWDFFLVFGTFQQNAPEEVEVNNFQGIYLSPQQAKALVQILAHNVQQYEQTFGEIKLDPRLTTPGGTVN